MLMKKNYANVYLKNINLIENKKTLKFNHKNMNN